MSERCGMVRPVIESFITIKFIGEDEEKYGLPTWKRCTSPVKDSYLCEEHRKNPIKVLNGKDASGKDVLVEFLGWPEEASHSQPIVK
jgi:hypothetical protein